MAPRSSRGRLGVARLVRLLDRVAAEAQPRTSVATSTSGGCPSERGRGSWADASGVSGAGASATWGCVRPDRRRMEAHVGPRPGASPRIRLAAPARAARCDRARLRRRARRSRRGGAGAGLPPRRRARVASARPRRSARGDASCSRPTRSSFSTAHVRQARTSDRRASHARGLRGRTHDVVTGVVVRASGGRARRRRARCGCGTTATRDRGLRRAGGGARQGGRLRHPGRPFLPVEAIEGC